MREKFLVVVLLGLAIYGLFSALADLGILEIHFG
jgi:hypothetical protein